MNNGEYKKRAEAVGLARYAVIAPLVSRQLTAEERRQEIERIVASVHKFPPDIERRVSDRTVERWLNWYREGRSAADGVAPVQAGLEALIPTPRIDRGKARVLSPEVIERAARLRQEQPSRSTQTLVVLLQNEAAARGEEPPAIEVATLAYHLRARRLTRKALKKDGRAYPRYEHDHRNAVWQGDWSQGILVPDPNNPSKMRLCHLHAFIDDHTRYVVHAEFYFRQNLPCLEDCFRKAIIKGGVPERTYWDNGAVYQARQIQRLAARLGTHVIFATPYAPEGKGKVERFFRTVKDAFYPEAIRAGIQTLDELNVFFWKWLEIAYLLRVHSETGQTPTERWLAGGGSVREIDPAALADTFLWEERRLVDRSGCVHLAGNAYPVGEHMLGQWVDVRFDPFDLTRIRIYSEGEFVDAVAPMTLVAHTFRKAVPRHADKVAPLESSKSFRQQLSVGYRKEIEQTIAQGVRKGATQNHCFTRKEFGAYLSACLCDRQMTGAEAQAIADFFARYAPVVVATAMHALRQAVEEKGSQRHIRYYLDAVRDARLNGEVK